MKFKLFVLVILFTAILNPSISKAEETNEEKPPISSVTIDTEDEEIKLLLYKMMLTQRINILEKDLEITKLKQRNNAIVFGLTMVIAAMLLVYLIVYYRNMLRRKQQRIDDYTNLVMDLQHTISDKDSAASETIQTIFKDHFDMLNNLGDSITLLNDSAKNQKTAIREIKNLITQFGEDKKSLKDLEILLSGKTPKSINTLPEAS